MDTQERALVHLTDEQVMRGVGLAEFVTRDNSAPGSGAHRIRPIDILYVVTYSHTEYL
jgi:hypothetical protein